MDKTWNHDAQNEFVQLLYKAAPQLEHYVSQQWKAFKLGNMTNGKMEKDKLSSVGNDQPDGQVSIIRASYITISSHSSCTVPSVFKSVCCENTHIITAQSIPVAPGTSNALQCSLKLARQFIAQLSGSSLYQLTINPGETVTVQVPTSPGATGSLSPCCQEGLLGGPCVR
ncbi:hypothetical protein GBAR_LOCUS185 [Geodia barretti]|uniref:Uncharacterized protein n=1 Tax=Geodia barretti TaxID=519541 RepID=A0AA35VXL0_GEOBA|nr:hypothetical protein GBAR_LOCUS185 [Geodia barretti]